MEGSQKVIISTLMPDQFTKLKGLLGNQFQMLNFPMITTKNLDPDKNTKDIFSNLNMYNWLIFTSMRGVEGFYYTIQKLKLKTADFRFIKTACIGNSTALELKAIGIQPNFINPGNTSEEFVLFLKKEVLVPNDNVILIQGERADNKLEENLASCCKVKRTNVYKTIDLACFEPKLKEIVEENKYELIIFTSPSAFESFLNIYKYKAADNQLKIASIGKKTTKAIENLGFNVMLTAEKSDLEGLSNTINTFSQKNDYF
jgi:uroporphyrinogen-III synthase